VKRTTFLTGRRRALAIAASLLLSACGSSSVPDNGSNTAAPPVNETSLDDALRADVLSSALRGCDFLDPSYCQFPWPSNALTRPDDSTDTGLRLNLKLAGMPMNIALLPVNPSEWNQDDGFSPGQMILSYVPDLDLERSGAAPITDIEASLAPPAPIFIIDAETLQRHPIWVEHDQSGTAATPACGLVGDLGSLVGDFVGPLGSLLGAIGSGCSAALGPVFNVLGQLLDRTGLLPNSAFKIDPPALIIRPGINFTEGRRYIVAMRNLVDADGNALPARPHFRVFRDNHVSDLGAINDRRATMEDIFARLGQHGVDRESLYLAWDFTVRSKRNLAGRTLDMRDRAFEQLGDAAPEFEIVSVQDFDSGATIRRIEGRFTVPNFLTLPDGLCDNLPLLSELVDYCAAVEGLLGAIEGTGVPPLEQIGGVAGDALGLLLRDIGQLPLSRLFYGVPRGDFPQINPLQPTQQYRFQCEIPRTAVGSFEDPQTWVRPAAAMLYGHGLLGGKGEVGGSSTARLRELNFMHCAIDWIGMATRDVPTTLLILLELGQFRSLSDRLQQGIVNWHFMGRLMKHPDGLVSAPAFQTGDGRAVFDPGRLFYDGNSQGGILSAPVVATSPDIERASFGVPGMNYSTLLRRSVDFDLYGIFMYAAYPNSFDQSFLLSLINNLWERGENTGYANDLRNQDGYAGFGAPTPDKEILMHVAFGDHQVADVSAEVMNRSMKASVHLPGTEQGRHTNINPYWGMPAAVDGDSGSVMVVWDIGPLDNPFNTGTPPSPTQNIPPRVGQDPHGDPRREFSSGIQRYDFMLERRFTNVCGPRPCFARGYVSEGVASGAAGNASPFVRAPGPTLARPGTTVPLMSVAADPDLDALTTQWQVLTNAECVDELADADQATATLRLATACQQGEVELEVTVDDGRGGRGAHRTLVRIQ
jgi:hypothetical protein